MPRVEVKTFIQAPLERCFDLARSVDLHVQTAGRTKERVVRGRTAGLIELGETVTFRAKHFGLWQELTAQVTAFDRPHHFRDVSRKGAFASMQHDHHFESAGGNTLMLDHFDFRSPFGPLGALFDLGVLTRHMRRFLEERGQVLKQVAESEAWKKYLET